MELKNVKRGLDLGFLDNETGNLYCGIVAGVEGDDIRVRCTEINYNGRDYGKEYVIKLDDIYAHGDVKTELIEAIEADVEKAREDAISRYWEKRKQQG